MWAMVEKLSLKLYKSFRFSVGSRFFSATGRSRKATSRDPGLGKPLQRFRHQEQSEKTLHNRDNWISSYVSIASNEVIMARLHVRGSSRPSIQARMSRLAQPWTLRSLLVPKEWAFAVSGWFLVVALMFCTATVVQGQGPADDVNVT